MMRDHLRKQQNRDRDPFRLKAGRYLLPFAAGLLFFFGMNLLPVITQGRSDSLGNNTDSIWHYMKILRLRGELAPDTSFDLDVRLPTDARLYRLISDLGALTGFSLIGTLQMIWFAYSLLFVLGCFNLGIEVTGNPWGGAFLMASGWGFALSVGGHWGWDFSPIVPHDLATSFVPWLLIVWLRVKGKWGFALYLGALGMLAQIYPTTFVHLAFLTLGAQLLRDPRNIGTLLVGAGAFALTILPLAITWGGKGPVPREMMPLVLERLPYLAPGSLWRILSEFKIFFIQLVLAGAAGLLLRGTQAPDGWSKIRSLGLVALFAGLLGQATTHVPLLAPLFVSRASRFSYIWILLLQARAMSGPPRPVLKSVGILICVLSLGLRPNLAGPALAIIDGRGPREAINMYHLQDSAEFRELCDWIECNTGANSKVLTPPDDRYLFVRAYAKRPVALLSKDLGAVTHARSAHLKEVWTNVVRAKRAYGERDFEAVMIQAHEQGCACVVFPPEWDAQVGAEFTNDAGWVLLLREGVRHGPVALTPG